LYYNRLTATFDEPLQGDGPDAGKVHQKSASTSLSSSLLPPFGATDVDRERMMLWAKKERLPMFLRQ